MDDYLNEKELKNDLETLIFESQWGDAWGQHPALSYCNNHAGNTNLRRLVNLAAHEIRKLRNANSN